MKRIFILLILAIFSLYSCKNSTTSGKEGETAAPVASETKTEAGLLTEYLISSGDYANTRSFPSMIKPSTLLKVLDDSGTYVIDLRGESSYAKGHIKGAVNVKFGDIPAYFEHSIKPYRYDKIVMVCDKGQESSYTTMLLRLMGYGNVYSMRWGMSAWNPDLAAGTTSGSWDASVGSKYQSALEKGNNPPAAKGNYPEIHTGKTTGEEIFRERIKQLFAENPPDFTLSADTVCLQPEKYYIMDYDRKDRYESGHIAGAVRYKPGETLGIEREMRTIPAGKNVVVYCATGQSSAFVAAYLKLLGYKAHSLRYGNNAFMHDQMVRDKRTLSWEAYSDEEMLNNFPYVK